MSLYCYTFEYWQKELEKQEGKELFPCSTEGCKNLTADKGWMCIGCRRKEADEHQAKIDAFYENVPPCDNCGSKYCEANECQWY